jgi:DnaJ-domain-containing protein 1
MTDRTKLMFEKILSIMMEEMQCWMNDQLAGLLSSLGIDTAQLKRAASGQATSDPYRVLGLDKSSSDEEVKTRYLELVKKLHPDTSGVKGTAYFFNMVLVAYQMIKAERGWK